MSSAPDTARPTPQLLAQLRRGKSQLRDERRAMPLPDKVRAVVELQRACLPLLGRQRPLQPWERIWDIDR